uniref:Eukaryotic translation initiation factor 3 subunit A n=1 Tax=Globodera pallida TaxID=36090 RepID=A0A183CD26_GLOPA
MYRAQQSIRPAMGRRQQQFLPTTGANAVAFGQQQQQQKRHPPYYNNNSNGMVPNLGGGHALRGRGQPLNVGGGHAPQGWGQPPNFGGHALRGRGQPPADRMQQHRLLDPERELRFIRDKMQQLLYVEYVEANDLNKVLSWADEIRRNGINSTPLLDLIDKLRRNKTERLIPALYNAFLQSPESKPFIDRAELYLPAITYAFKPNTDDTLPNTDDTLPNTDDTLASVTDLCDQFGRISSKILHSVPPDQLNALRQHFLIHFSFFIRHLPSSTLERVLPQVSAAIRRCGGLFLSAPLVEAVEAVKPSPDVRRVRSAYAAFIANAEERKMFNDRVHVYFPLMLQQLHSNKSFSPRQQRSSATSLAIVLRLMRLHDEHPADLPLVLFELLHQLSTNAFHYACFIKDFEAAKQLWQFRDGQHLSINFYFGDVFYFAHHLWSNGNTSLAGKIAHFCFYQRDERPKTYADKMLQQLNVLNASYKQKLLNPSVSEQAREQYHRGFVKEIHEILLLPNRHIDWAGWCLIKIW